MIEFRQKDFGLVSSILTGTSTGITLGGLVGKISQTGSNNTDWGKINKSALIGGALGALAGAIAGGIGEVRTRFNRKTTVDRRLMVTVVENLRKSGLKEGESFTRDPKKASDLRTKVCICLSKVSGELRILINTVSDQKLKELTDDLVKNIPNKSAVTEKASDRFNDITITTISDSTMDAGLVTGIAERFIHSGYPVQLVEVG